MPELPRHSNSGPYIVSQQRRDRFDAMGPDRDVWTVLSRVAVGSLEEARQEALRIVREAFDEVFKAHGEGYDYASAEDAAIDGQAFEIDAQTIPESGGSVDLPDGTRIEVEAKTRAKLFRELPVIIKARFGAWPNMPVDVLCRVWNAQNGVSR